MHYLAPGLQVRPTPRKDGFGVFATRRIPAGTLLAVFGGHIVETAALAALPEADRRFMVQVEHGLFQVTLRNEVEDADFINHSCNANAGLHGQVSIKAMRVIEEGDEVCMDYAMCDTDPSTGFVCGCGTARCRGIVHPEDWRRPDLQRRYAGWFAPYVQRMIDAQQAGLAERSRPRMGSGD